MTDAVRLEYPNKINIQHSEAKLAVSSCDDTAQRLSLDIVSIEDMQLF